MRCFKTVLLMGFAVLLVFSNSAVFGWEQPPGQPPYGLAIKGTAEGERLSGVLVVEFLNYNPDTFWAEGGASVVVRLRKSGELKIFFTTVPVRLSTSNPRAVQDAIMERISTSIINEFFGEGASVTLTLRFIGEYKTVYGECGTVTPKKGLPYQSCTYYVVTDVELAAK